MVTAAMLWLCGALLLCGAQLANAADCPADGAGLTHDNAVYDATANAGTPTSGPKLPDMSSRPMRTYGAVGSCSGSTGSFDGGEIVVAATIPLHGPSSTKSYARIMRFTAEIFLDWVNLEKGGLMVGGKRYSMRFVWTDDKQSASDAALAMTHSIRRQDAHFGWGGYGSTISRLQAEQAALDGVLFMASIAAAPSVFENRELTFGGLPPDYTYIQNAVRAVAAAATGSEGVPAASALRVGLVYMSPLDGMCEPIEQLALSLGMT